MRHVPQPADREDGAPLRSRGRGRASQSSTETASWIPIVISLAVVLRKPLPPRAHLVADTDLRGCRSRPTPPSGVRSPSRPSGRKTRIRIRIVKTIDSVQSEPGACQPRPSLNAWMRPIRIAPSTAPGRLPMPPNTAAVNAISPSWKPWSKRTGLRRDRRRARRPGQRAGEQEREGDRPVDVDAHDRARVHVLRGGAHRLALRVVLDEQT